ncbi:glycosyltransferase family 4 protein [Chloroflexota bacterium]
MKLKICMLLPLRYGPNMQVFPQMGISSYLVNFGHQVTWVISTENSRSNQQFVLNGIHVYTSPYIRYLNDSSLLGKIVDRIPASFRRVCLIRKVLKETKYDLIFTRDDTFDGLISTCIKKRYRIPFVYQLTNPLTQAWESYKIEASKPLFLWYLLSRITVLLRIFVMKKANLILQTTKGFEDGLVEKGIPKSKLMTYSNGVDIESFINKDDKDIREKYRLGDSKVVIYVGIMGKPRCLEVLIRAFSKVKEERGDVKLLMVGDGTDRENLEKLAGELGLKDDVIFTGHVHQSEVSNFIAAADIGISPYPPFPYYTLCSPIKTFEYMVMAKPVVASEEVMEHKEVISQSGGGVLVPSNAESFACAVIELLNNPETAQEMGRKGHEWLVKNRSYEILARKLEERLIQSIVVS